MVFRQYEHKSVINKAVTVLCETLLVFSAFIVCFHFDRCITMKTFDLDKPDGAVVQTRVVVSRLPCPFPVHQFVCIYMSNNWSGSGCPILSCVLYSMHVTNAVQDGFAQ